jgi:phosphoglucomutase
LGQLTPTQLDVGTLAGDPIKSVLTATPEAQPIGGIKVVTVRGWFAARPSGTESVYKLYAESFSGPDHLRRIQEEAQAIVATRSRCARGNVGVSVDDVAEIRTSPILEPRAL